MEKPIFFYHQYIAFLVIVCAAVSHGRPYSQPEPSYLKFVLNATEFPSEEYYDYIVVGGGTAGCPLAASLSESYRVLLLERGGVAHGNPNLMTQEGFLTTLTEVDTFDSPAQAFISEEGVPNARGRILGGSSAINAGFYSRADPDFFRKSGLDWDLRLVNQSYDWVEKAIVFRPDLRNWQSAVRDGFLEAGVNPYNGYSLDHLLGTKIGGSTFDVTGKRHSAADLLNYANAANIKVAIHASVERVVLASTSYSRSKITAIGVVFRDQRGQYHHAMLHEKGETLPLILGIPVAYHLPHVGLYLYDNPRNGVSFVPSIPLEHSLIQVVGITELGAYLEAASNVIPFTPPARSVFIRPASAPLYITVATLMEKIVGPLSTGLLRLASTDVRVNPIVRFNYFSHPIDVERCVNGTRKIGDVLRSRSMEEFMFREWFGARRFRFIGPALPVDQSDYVQMADFCRRTVSTIWHYHGGCVVGKVVDRDYHVNGIGALRVVDGSTFSVSPGTNPQATLMMMGRYE
ncbi:hypothetical protein GH714_010886 [Hevea brasiliensis]|uniref:Glucose-methanol-choline oxidoreductase N-terminal domain-containing protein n=1 Tax=Hevea brasiliensis TaxID=3981 RepID=A0A6A6LS18_HEVBR|nr:hypothetical protein GH714_010886 [Hevea brasiliensis]